MLEEIIKVITETDSSGKEFAESFKNDGVAGKEFNDSFKSDGGSGEGFAEAFKNDVGSGKDPKELQIHEAEKTEKKGGSYAEVKKDSDGSVSEVHHMPADSINDLPRDDGPAIKMDREDHKQTASYGNSKDAQEYRQKQRELIEEGKFDEAVQMDIDDIHEKFGDKYDDAIEEMKEYKEKLKEEGHV